MNRLVAAFLAADSPRASGNHVRMLAFDLRNQPFPEAERLGVRIINPEDRHPLLDPSARPSRGPRSCTAWPNWASRSHTLISPGETPRLNRMKTQVPIRLQGGIVLAYLVHARDQVPQAGRIVQVPVLDLVFLRMEVLLTARLERLIDP